ncbi:MAG: nicotianamine synthase [Proteobacteria bacterium]|nr:nicotianamine synthase [Pseudomonadota bacterium]
MMQYSCGGEVSSRLHRIYHELATASSLEPCERVDQLFNQLVGLTLAGEHVAEHVLADPIVCAIRENLWWVCSRGEFALESYWSARIAAAAEPWAELRQFPYYGNYAKLARLELYALRGAGTENRARILFIGCGPLPLTSIVMSADYSLEVANFDIDASACTRAREVVDRLGLRQQIAIEQRDAFVADDLCEFDVVCVAALVGMNRREKKRLFDHLARCMRPGAILLARTSRSLRTLLYPCVDSDHLGAFELVVEIHPHDEIINSVLIARCIGDGRQPPEESWQIY